MKRWMRLGCLFCSIGVAGFAVAQNPFVGTWKLNQGKSHLTGGTMKFSSAGNGMIRETIAEGSYTFKTDGQSYPSLFGDTENWKKLSGHSWQSTVHMNGGYVSTDTLNVSDDGKSLTVTSTGHPSRWVGLSRHYRLHPDRRRQRPDGDLEEHFIQKQFSRGAGVCCKRR